MHSYNADIVAWANEQAGLIRAGRLDQLDLEHIADEIEDVGKSEQRELENRMAVLLTHLIKWQYQPERRGRSWRLTIIDQRDSIARRLKKTPSLKNSLQDPDWWADAWQDARRMAAQETNIEYALFPTVLPWNYEQIMQPEFWPE
jgi:Domain of unknown function DUF29